MERSKQLRKQTAAAIITNEEKSPGDTHPVGERLMSKHSCHGNK